MQHSHEALDRPGGFSRVNLLAPLRHRDFRLLWAGMTRLAPRRRDLPGRDGLAGLRLWNAPAALSLLGIGMTVPTIAFLLPAGVLSDRLDRRTLMLRADVARAVVVAALAVLALTGSLTFWELVVARRPLRRRHAPSSLPPSRRSCRTSLPARDLAAANSLDQFVRPIALRLAGPALGGALVAGVGLGRQHSRSTPHVRVSAVACSADAPAGPPRRSTSALRSAR